MYDFVIKGGIIIDGSQELNVKCDLALSDGCVATLDASIPESKARQVIDATGLIVTPGLVDMHAHVYEGVSRSGVNADTTCLSRGVTTVIDAGSSGAMTFPGLRMYIVESSQTRILAFLHLSLKGLITDEMGPDGIGELEDLRYANTQAALETIEANRDIIVGVKIRMQRQSVGNNGKEGFKRALMVANAADLPLMIDIGESIASLIEILAEVRPGDLITHSYHSRDGGILDEEGELLPAVRDAASRGVLFDVGHGQMSFSFRVARRAISQGLLPSTIGSDLHAHCLHGPVHDLATTMSKFLYLGLSLSEVIARSTWKPAQAIRRDNLIGTLRPGSCADVTLLELRNGNFQLQDASWGIPQETVSVDRLLVPVGVLREGKLVFLSPGRIVKKPM